MRISEFIKKLEAEMERVGDVEVCAMTDEGDLVEINDPCLCERQNGKYEVVDGQQRLTSLYLLLNS